MNSTLANITRNILSKRRPEDLSKTVQTRDGVARFEHDAPKNTVNVYPELKTPDVVVDNSAVADALGLVNATMARLEQLFVGQAEQTERLIEAIKLLAGGMQVTVTPSPVAIQPVTVKSPDVIVNPSIQVEAPAAPIPAPAPQPKRVFKVTHADGDVTTIEEE